MLRYEKNLSQHKSAQCHVKIDDLTSPCEMKFISYTTEIIHAVRHDGVWHLKMSGKYSQTTSKQVTWFLREYFPSVSREELEETIGTDKWLEV